MTEALCFQRQWSQKLALRSYCSSLYLGRFLVVFTWVFGLRCPQAFEVAHSAGSSPCNTVRINLSWAMSLRIKTTNTKDLRVLSISPKKKKKKKSAEKGAHERIRTVDHELQLPLPGIPKSKTSLTQPQTPFQVRGGESEPGK